MQDTDILKRERSAISSYDQPAEAVFVDENLGQRAGYDITVMAHEFNIFTLCNFLDRGMITVPVFQRGFVWDKAKASRFIESLALGLPVPELFLYQSKLNDWWVVDGQQRMLSVYFFSKGRFPYPKKLVEISRLMRRNNVLSEEQWKDKRLFFDFELDLRSRDGEKPSFLHGMSYKNLGKDIERKSLRAVVIRQHVPEGDKAAFEIFSRLNTGGVNLSQQQIRRCVYRSDFLDMIDDLNVDSVWRMMYGQPLKKTGNDAEVILRAFAMLESSHEYAHSMRGFLNGFCRKKAGASQRDIKFLRELFVGFLGACGGKKDLFHRNKRFSSALFEAVFVASLRECREDKRMPKGELKSAAIAKLARDPKFEEAARQSSNTKAKVLVRLNVAEHHIAPL